MEVSKTDHPSKPATFLVPVLAGLEKFYCIYARVIQIP
jgi:hypothetical protein